MFQYFTQKACAGETSLISKYYLEYGLLCNAWNVLEVTLLQLSGLLEYIVVF